MAQVRTSIFLPRSLSSAIGLLTDEQLGELVRAVYRYDEKKSVATFTDNPTGEALFLSLVQPWMATCNALYGKLAHSLGALQEDSSDQEEPQEAEIALTRQAQRDFCLGSEATQLVNQLAANSASSSAATPLSQAADEKVAAIVNQLSPAEIYSAIKKMDYPKVRYESLCLARIKYLLQVGVTGEMITATVTRYMHSREERGTAEMYYKQLKDLLLPGIFADYLPLIDKDCPLCGGKGVIYGQIYLASDGYEQKMRTCECQHYRQQLREKLRQSG